MLPFAFLKVANWQLINSKSIFKYKYYFISYCMQLELNSVFDAIAKYWWKKKVGKPFSPVALISLKFPLNSNSTAKFWREKKIYI